MSRFASVLFTLFALCSPPATAQEVGDPAAGHEVAAQICAPCHAVERGQGQHLHPRPLPFEALEALPFEDIARTPGITPMALFAWMASSHPSMPNIVLEEGDLRNVIAYIISLDDPS